MSADRFEWPAEDPLTVDALTDRIDVLQRKRGHRYSLDDVLTAFEAVSAAHNVASYLDLGCGIGSVLLSVRDRLSSTPRTMPRTMGVEAQEVSFRLVTENVRRSGFSIELIHSDFRQLDASSFEPFELITGTPPYAPPGTATPSPDSQRAHARIEYRGGIEAYLDVAQRFLTPSGTMVVCSSGDEARARAAIEASELFCAKSVAAIPREGAAPLFYVWRLSRDESVTEEQVSFVARDSNGKRTESYIALRRFFGLPKASALPEAGDKSTVEP